MQRLIPKHYYKGVFIMKFMTLVLLFIVATGCSHLQRHQNSGYGYTQSKDEESYSPKVFYEEQTSNESELAAAELGLETSRPLTEQEMKELNTRILLKRLESRIPTEKERKQYFNYKPMFNSDEDRISFLYLPTFEARERQAVNLNLTEKFNNFDDTTLKLIEDNDVGVGMNPQAVRESWGDPDSIQVAGNEVYGNQAWTYTKMVSSSDGYKKEVRIIFFESGRVVGWESF